MNKLLLNVELHSIISYNKAGGGVCTERAGFLIFGEGQLGTRDSVAFLITSLAVDVHVVLQVLIRLLTRT